jgi:hypothetical protein
MAGTTYSKFFWADWRSEPGLPLCSFAARGLWIEMLALMAETDDGSLSINGKEPTISMIAELTRARGQDVEPLLQELETYGAFSRDRGGKIYCRRMRKDALKRRRNSEAGKKSVEVRSRKYSETPTGSNGVDQHTHLTTISHQPSTTSHQPAADARSSKEKTQDDLSRMAKLEQALGQNLTNRTNAFAFVGQMISLEADGIDIELDLFPMLAERRDSGKLSSTWKTLSYFRDAALEFRASRLAKVAMEEARADQASERPRAEWEPKLRALLFLGYWRDDGVDGPSPFEPNCLVPADMLERARTLWNRQGQVPSDDSQHLHYVKRPTPFWGDNVVALPARTG